MKEYVLNQKSKALALRIIRLYKYLHDEKREYIMSRQVLKSGTSIGANIAEGFYAQSHPDLISKFSIALKEAGETKYWIELLHESEYITTTEFNSIENDIIEIIKILTSSVKSLKE